MFTAYQSIYLLRAARTARQMTKHICDERIFELAFDPHTVSRVEALHFENCGTCFRKFVEHVKQFEHQRRDSIRDLINAVNIGP